MLLTGLFYVLEAFQALKHRSEHFITPRKDAILRTDEFFSTHFFITRRITGGHLKSGQHFEVTFLQYYGTQENGCDIILNLI